MGSSERIVIVWDGHTDLTREESMQAIAYHMGISVEALTEAIKALTDAYIDVSLSAALCTHELQAFAELPTPRNKPRWGRPPNITLRQYKPPFRKIPRKARSVI